MIRLIQRAQDVAGRIVFCVIVFATMMIDRISEGGQGVLAMATGSELNPQQSILRLVAFLIAGSLSMMAIGYRARA
jgi:hypothetical protein